VLPRTSLYTPSYSLATRADIDGFEEGEQESICSLNTEES
jgi:hypothetical protein